MHMYTENKEEKKSIRIDIDIYSKGKYILIEDYIYLI